MTLLAGLLLVGGAPGFVHSAEDPSQETRYRIYDREIPKESLFDITFGSPPPMATERGILIIDAYIDRNGNNKRDADDPNLEKEISCRIGEIDYPVPAFIPGLGYNDTYTVVCNGEQYQPDVREKSLFIEKRGQVIRVDLPCRPVSQEKTSGLEENGSVSRQP